ncbi:MAG: hypothetical protein DI498_02510 [Paracoccus denitrificans]|nr:MAG: hypothetical protein DI498_02510 [Paracoccus denitrificans]PZO86015.1 MAG: hypothetical protein DI633_02510 [Paracoccus denitrificans]
MNELQNLFATASCAVAEGDLPTLTRTVDAIARVARHSHWTAAQCANLLQLARHLDHSAEATRRVIETLRQAAQSANAYRMYTGEGRMVVARAAIEKQKF